VETKIIAALAGLVVPLSLVGVEIMRLLGVQ
jgi:hypothetical protein